MTPSFVVTASLVLLALILSWWAYSLRATRHGAFGGATQREPGRETPGIPGAREIRGYLSVRPSLDALATLVPLEVKDLPTTQYQIARDYLVRYLRYMYGLKPFPLHVTLTDNIEALLKSVKVSKGEAVQHAPLSFQADEQEPKVTVAVNSDAAALKVVGENTQTKRLNAKGDTGFTFLLQPVAAEDLDFVVRIKYTHTVLQNTVSKETTSVTTTEGNAQPTTKKTETDTNTISVQQEEVELAALALTCSVRSLLGLTGSQLKIISTLGTFLFTIGLVIVWRLAFPTSFNQMQAVGYLVAGLASALGLTIVDPSKVRLPWVPQKEKPAET